MSDDAKKYLWDVREAVGRINRFINGRTFNDYQNDEMLRAAVERQFEIIGEALNQLSKRDPDTAKRIPDLAQIVAFRNILIHGYATVDDRLVWGVLERQLSSLQQHVDELLDGGNESGPG